MSQLMTPILTAAQMKEVDRRSLEAGIPSLILMENAGQRVIDAIAAHYSPFSNHQIAVICGKGNNGGDGLVVARQLFTRFRAKSLHVVLLHPHEELSPDAAANLAMLEAAGCPFTHEFPPSATLVIDAILGTGLNGKAEGPALEAIRHINQAYSSAKVVAIDLPSGLPSDTGKPTGEYIRADLTVTFTAPKPAHVLGPNCYAMGELVIAPIGSPAHLLTSDFSLITAAAIRTLFSPRAKDSNKGIYGHVLAAAGSRGRTGAAIMCGSAALHAGAGLVTVASVASAISLIASHMPELMTEPLPETSMGELASTAYNRLLQLAQGKSVLAIGPGLGTDHETTDLVRRLFREADLPMIFDADALTALSSRNWMGDGTRFRVLTPHPGEMSRLTDRTVPEIQANRHQAARTLARERRVIVVLKGDRTLIAFPDGRVWVNPTGSPALAKAGTGDILTGLIAGLVSQFPKDREVALAAAVYLHGLAGELGAAALTEQSFTATDLLRFLPDAIRHIQHSE